MLRQQLRWNECGPCWSVKFWVIDIAAFQMNWGDKSEQDDWRSPSSHEIFFYQLGKSGLGTLHVRGCWLSCSRGLWLFGFSFFLHMQCLQSGCRQSEGRFQHRCSLGCLSKWDASWNIPPTENWNIRLTSEVQLSLHAEFLSYSDGLYRYLNLQWVCQLQDINYDIFFI